MHLNGRKSLLCIDNAEDLIESSNNEFKQLIVECLKALPNLYILVTSRTQIGIFEESEFQETHYAVNPLRTAYSVELFLKLASP